MGRLLRAPPHPTPPHKGGRVSGRIRPPSAPPGVGQRKVSCGLARSCSCGRKSAFPPGVDSGLPQTAQLTDRPPEPTCRAHGHGEQTP